MLFGGAGRDLQALDCRVREYSYCWVESEDFGCGDWCIKLLACACSGYVLGLQSEIFL